MTGKITSKIALLLICVSFLENVVHSFSVVKEMNLPQLSPASSNEGHQLTLMNDDNGNNPVVIKAMIQDESGFHNGRPSKTILRISPSRTTLTTESPSVETIATTVIDNLENRLTSDSLVPNKDDHHHLHHQNFQHQQHSSAQDSVQKLDSHREMKTNVAMDSSSSSSSSTNSPSSNVPEEEILECGSVEMLHKGKFSPYDYTVLIGMLVISIGIGVFYGYFQKSGSSSDDFLLGSGMSIFPVTLSLTTSFITAIELLGNPSEMFYQGTQFVLIVIPMVIVIPVAVKIFYPIYFKLELTSCYEYLGIRFGKKVRILGAILYIIQMSFYTAVAVLAPAIALSKATGLNTRLAVVLIYMVCIFYSSQGGMKAVVIADTFQACVLAFSLILIVVLGYLYTGGAFEIFEKSSERDRIEFFNFDFNPTTRHTVFSVTVGGFFYWTSLFCTNQASVQKCMSLKSLKLAKLALGFAILGLILVFLMNFYTGLMVFAHYSDCDPLTAGRISASDQLLPFYVMDVYEHIPSVTGIFVAGIFAASLGTVASALNSLSAVTCEDLLINGFNVKIRPESGATYVKWMSLGYGLFSFVLVFVVEKLGGVLQATLTLNGLVGGVTLGLFVLGIATKRANSKGAFYGGIIALIIVIYLGVMAQLTNVPEKDLPLSLEKCNCFVNETSSSSLSSRTVAEAAAAGALQFGDINLSAEQGDSSVLSSIIREINSTVDRINNIPNEEVTNREDSGFRFESIYRISYIWYTAIGTILTIVFGYLISIILDAVQIRKILRIVNKENSHHLAGNMRRATKENLAEVKCSDQFKMQNIFVKEIETNTRNQQNQKTLVGCDNFALKIDDEK